VAVLALDASLLILDDELGLLSASLLPSPGHSIGLPVQTLEARLVPSFWMAHRPSGRGSTEMRPIHLLPSGAARYA
jgi:hypothetical protein